MAAFDVVLVVAVVAVAGLFLLRRATQKLPRDEAPAAEPQLKGALGRAMAKRQK